MRNSLSRVVVTEDLEIWLDATACHLGEQGQEISGTAAGLFTKQTGRVGTGRATVSWLS